MLPHAHFLRELRGLISPTLCHRNLLCECWLFHLTFGWFYESKSCPSCRVDMTKDKITLVRDLQFKVFPHGIAWLMTVE